MLKRGTEGAIPQKRAVSIWQMPSISRRALVPSLGLFLRAPLERHTSHVLRGKCYGKIELPSVIECRCHGARASRCVDVG